MRPQHQEDRGKGNCERQPALRDFNLFRSVYVGLGFRIGRGGMSALSPFYPQLRTLVGAAGTAASCQKLTHAPQQNDAHELAYSITSSHRLLL